MKPAGRERDAAIDYRMMRRAYIERVRSGDVALRDACDAERDLVRAGRHYGTPRRSACPICSRESLRNVTYLFGPRLPKSGRCITSADELRSFDQRPEQYTAYTVEVCLACEWHHLLASSPRGGCSPRRRKRTRRTPNERAATRVRRRA